MSSSPTPPFMSPKGGIKPHNRFSIQAKRSEVLFVDYMAEHLTPGGRAGIIVPEGIIFQSQGAYTQLRKILVEDSLVAVVSLPAGVFNPYSGVKTSILILDKSLAKQAQTIAFFKIEHDGFGLGAQRREIANNDLPQARAEIADYMRRLRARESMEDFQPTLGLVVPKEKIAANGDYNLSGERYREGTARATRYPIVPLAEVAEVIAGQSPPGESYNNIGIGTPFYQGKTEFCEMFIGLPTTWTTEPQRFAEAGDVLMSVRAPVGPVNLATQRICIGRGLAAIRPAEDRLMSPYAFYFLRSQETHIKGDAGAVFASINRGNIEKLQIPLPPLEVQKEIVAEIESYQKIIDGARAVLDHYRPHIPIHPDWPMVELASVTRFQEGPGILAKDFRNEGIPLVRLAGLGGSTVTLEGCNYLDPEMVAQKWNHFRLRVGDILVSTSASFGRPAIVPSATEGAVFYTGLIRFQPLDASLDAKYLETFLGSPAFLDQGEAFATGSSIRHFGPMHLKQMRIHLPPIAIQRAIVAEIEAEQALVAANRELITRFEKKIQVTLARVWGEDEPAPAEA